MVEEAVIKNHLDQQKQPVRLLSKEDASMTLSLAGKQENIVTRDLYFQVVSSSGPSPFESESGDALNRTDKAITLRLPLASGSLDIDYCLHPNSYMLDMVVTARGINNLFAPSMRTLDLRWTDRARQLEKGFDFEQRYACIRYHEADGSTDYLSETSDKEKDIEENLDWIAFKNQFFSAVLISQQEFHDVHLTSKLYEKGQGYLKNYEATMQTAFDPTGTQPTQLQMYLGPNDFHTLKAHNDLSLIADKDLELEDLVYLGWPIVRWINRWFIIYLFDWLKGFGLHMGLVLLLLTIIVKALVYPATKKSYLASARMRVLKPKIDELNKKYPKQEDAMKKQQEMMQLYSQYGVSPMGGCLPMLIQAPIWIALFNFSDGEQTAWISEVEDYYNLVTGEHCLAENYRLEPYGFVWLMTSFNRKRPMRKVPAIKAEAVKAEEVKTEEVKAEEVKAEAPAEKPAAKKPAAKKPARKKAAPKKEVKAAEAPAAEAPAAEEKAEAAPEKPAKKAAAKRTRKPAAKKAEAAPVKAEEKAAAEPAAEEKPEA